MVGDDTYDGKSEAAHALRARGLLLCSNRVIMQHPYYNSKKGRQIWVAMTKETDDVQHFDSPVEGATVCMKTNKEGMVVVEVEIQLPKTFHYLLREEEEMYYKFQQEGQNNV